MEHPEDDTSTGHRHGFLSHLGGGRAARRETDEELALDIDLDFPEYVEGIRNALAGFVSHARQAGLDAPVPTTPDWTVRELLAHQGMVHRWATATITGQGPDVDTDALRAEGLAAADPVGWMRQGCLRLVTALQEAPHDLEAPVFLRNAPAPRLFWARRQCHETTIHSVDAQSAALGRMPRAEDTEITREVALDGIDELLRGFLTRRSAQLRSDRPLTFGVHPTDVDRSWLVHVSTEPAVVERNVHGHADVVLKAPAEVLYLALWNRSDELQTEGYDLWRRTARVSWT